MRGLGSGPQGPVLSATASRFLRCGRPCTGAMGLCDSVPALRAAWAQATAVGLVWLHDSHVRSALFGSHRDSHVFPFCLVATQGTGAHNPSVRLWLLPSAYSSTSARRRVCSVCVLDDAVCVQTTRGAHGCTVQVGGRHLLALPDVIRRGRAAESAEGYMRVVEAFWQATGRVLRSCKGLSRIHKGP